MRGAGAGVAFRVLFQATADNITQFLKVQCARWGKRSPQSAEERLCAGRGVPLGSAAAGRAFPVAAVRRNFPRPQRT